MEVETKDNKVKNGGKKGMKIYLPLILVVILVLVGSFYWYRQYSRYIYTDDAHIEADMVTVSPKILGRIAKIYADEGDSVHNGMELVDLDSSDLVAQLGQALAAKNQALAMKTQAEAKYEADKENINVVQIGYEKAKDDFDRANIQFYGQVIAKEQYDHSQKNIRDG